jgi:N-acetylmuramoyl-L-alanine amidase
MNTPTQLFVPADFRFSSIPASSADLDKLARTLAGEASSEPFDGKIAVAWAIRNRVMMDLWRDGKKDWWGEGWAGVIGTRWQFTCWEDHNKTRIEKLTLGDASYQECMLAALCVVKGLIPDNVAGSTHYFNPRAVKKPPPWSIGRTPVCIHGNHHFYTGVEPGDPNYTKPATA